MKYSATAKHKTLNQEFKVKGIDLTNQTVQCEGKVPKGSCMYCSVDTECDEPYFKISDAELVIKVDG